jgi:hypothetical protein
MKKYQVILCLCFAVVVGGSYIIYDKNSSSEQEEILTQTEILSEQNVDHLEFTKIENVGFGTSKNYGSIEEVEEYADLIVIATKQDSSKQNTKNTTEFDPTVNYG